jgi:hypothetical protein
MNTRRTAKKASGTVPKTAKVVPLREGKPVRGPVLGPGAHFAKVFCKVGEGRYEVQLFTGERLAARVADEVDLELVDRCLAEQDVVLVGAVGGEVMVFGALRTREKKPETVVVEASRKLVLRAGKARIELHADGKVRLGGTDVTVDAPREVRLASSRVEIP